MIKELNERSQAILKCIVDSYMETGIPVGSKTLSHNIGIDVSPATIRAVMAELENTGLLHSPHTSAGRLPTQQGLQLYIDGLMEVGNISTTERSQIDRHCSANGQSIEQLYESASTMLSGLSSAAGLVIAPKTDKPLQYIQFVSLDPNRILVILVMQGGLVENRVMNIKTPISNSALQMAANYLNKRLEGKTLENAKTIIFDEIARHRTELDSITENLVKRGIALASDSEVSHLIIRGQSKLLEDVNAVEDIEKARQLLAALEEQETVSQLLNATSNAEGVEVFVGTENSMFEHTGWSMIISPYKTPDCKIVGAIGVIGPTRLNYSRIVPIVDYTTKVMEKLLSA